MNITTSHHYHIPVHLLQHTIAVPFVNAAPFTTTAFRFPVAAPRPAGLSCCSSNRVPDMRAVWPARGTCLALITRRMDARAKGFYVREAGVVAWLGVEGKFRRFFFFWIFFVVVPFCVCFMCLFYAWNFLGPTCLF